MKMLVFRSSSFTNFQIDVKLVRTDFFVFTLAYFLEFTIFFAVFSTPFYSRGKISGKFEGKIVP